MRGIARWTGTGGSYRTGQRFFASRYGQPVPGLAFFALSLISTQQRRSFPIQIEQVVRTAEEHAAARAKRAAKATPDPARPRQPGRPKGSTTKAKTAVELTSELTRLHTMVRQVLAHIGTLLPMTSLVLDAHFGNNNARQMVRRCNLHLVSKRRADSAVHLPYAGAYAGREPRRRYGDKLEPLAIPEHHRWQTTAADGIETRIYQLTAHHTRPSPTPATSW